MAALSWLWPLSRDAPACPRGLQKLPRLERGGFCGEWTICHLLLGLRHSFMAQATCKQMWGRSWQWDTSSLQREWSSQDSHRRPRPFQEHRSCSAARQQTPVNAGGRAAECWPHTHPISLSSPGLSSHLKDISIDSGSSILETCLRKRTREGKTKLWQLQVMPEEMVFMKLHQVSS